MAQGEIRLHGQAAVRRPDERQRSTKRSCRRRWPGRFVGGYGIGARIIMERMKPGVDPLGPDNIFGIGTGPLTLSGVYSTCRFATMGKSPLTGYLG